MEVVSICTPTVTHARLAYDTLQARKHERFNLAVAEVTGLDGVNVLRVCEAALRSSASGRVVQLSERGEESRR